MFMDAAVSSFSEQLGVLQCTYQQPLVKAQTELNICRSSADIHKALTTRSVRGTHRPAMKVDDASNKQTLHTRDGDRLYSAGW